MIDAPAPRAQPRAVPAPGRAEATLLELLAVIEAREGVVRAWEHIEPEAALEAAKRCDSESPRGPLHGVAVGVKDLFDTVDMPTSWGSAIYGGRRPGRDASAVALLRNAGGIVLGKTVTTEFAYASPGVTRNPHGLDRTPGGSSSGSAAAVAAGMVPLALGTQTAGSVIRPAAFCGVVGYKPTFGTIPRAGVLQVSDSLDTVGVFAATVPNAALLAGSTSLRPDLLDVAIPAWQPRVALCRSPNWEQASPDARSLLEKAAEELRAAGAWVEDMTLPSSFHQLSDAQLTVQAFEGALALAHEHRVHRKDLSEPLIELLDRGAATPPSAYEDAQRCARECRAAFSRAACSYDALLTPSTVGEAPQDLSTTGEPTFNRDWTFLHVPCVHLPIATGPQGMPLGVQLVGHLHDDARLLAVAEWSHRVLDGWSGPLHTAVSGSR